MLKSSKRDQMVEVTETKEGWRVSITGQQFTLTEEQLLRLRRSLNRMFNKTETLRRLCQKRWDKHRVHLRHREDEYFVVIGRVAVPAEGFIRSLKKEDQSPAREHLIRMGYKDERR